MKKVILIVIIGILVSSGISTGASVHMTRKKTMTITPTEYDMVIVAPEVFSESLAPLIEHKNSHGVQTFLKTMEDIDSTFDGRDAAERVKYFIKDALEEYNINYALLVGGRMGQRFRWYVPVRYASLNDGVLHKMYLSDLYFADVYKDDGSFEDWDSNKNGVFAEWALGSSKPGDVLDLVPDVAVGRLPCRSVEEVQSMVAKIIAYETGSSGENWLHRILLVGGDTNPGVGDPFPYEGEADCDWALTHLEGFNATKLYTSYGTLSCVQDFLSSFNTGNGFVYYAGHGWQDKMGTFPPNGTEVVFFMDNEHVSSLANNGMYPVMVVGCCVTTSFDVGTLNFLRIFHNYKKFNSFFAFKYECIPECISWNMVKQPSSGCIAWLGSSSTTWGEVGDKNHDGIPDGVQTGCTPGVCQEFFRLYGEEDGRILGELFTGAVSHVVEEFSAAQDQIQCKCVTEYMLIGDPSLVIGGYPSPIHR